jgi:hypothetical protein
MWLTAGGTSAAQMYTQKIYRSTQWNGIHRTYITIEIHKPNNNNILFTFFYYMILIFDFKGYM